MTFGTMTRLLSVAGAFAILGARSASAQMTVDNVDITLHAGVDRVAAFNVINETADVLQLSLYANDWDRDDTGRNRFFPLGKGPGSCGTKLHIFPQALRVAAKGTETVRITLDGADSLAAECWGIVFIENHPPAPSPTSHPTVQFVTRIGVKVYVVPKNANIDASLDSMGVVPHRGQPGDTVRQDVIFTIHNAGGRQIQAVGTVEFRRPDNSVVAQTKLDPIPVLPGALRQVVSGVPRLPAGHYIVIADFSYGGDADVAGQAEFDVK